MTRRRLVVLASAATLMGLIVLVTLSVAFLTQTPFGRRALRSFLVARVSSAVHGKLYLGRLSGSILRDISIDSLELRDQDDSLFLASGPLSLHFNPVDLLDKRIAMSNLRMTRPVVHIDIDSSGTVNFRKIFPPGKPGRPPKGRSLGDYVAVTDAALEDLTLQVRMPWSPDTTLRGAQRDSAIRYALSREDKIIRRVQNHFVQTLRWTEGQLALKFGRLDDKEASGRFLDISNLDVNGFDPPFKFHNVRGTARMAGDSLWVDFPHLDLPASTGSAKGKVWWGGSVPVRWNLNVSGDSVSMADVAWVYPTLPKTGRGRMKLVMRSESDPHVVDYILTEMDVHSTDSWLRGSMTFGIGAPITVVKDVDLVAEPVDFRLIETLSGGPLPYPFRGTLTGTVKARGGPLTHFVVDASDIVYRDANVAGAVTVGQGRGELDILKPSATVFHGFSLALDQLDLRTVQFLNPGFPRLDGVVAGHATLDSSIVDIRFRDADLTHTFGGDPVSRVTGAGRVTFAENTVYDVALSAIPLSFTTLHDAYKGGRVPIRGEYAGPLRLQGTLQDLDVSTDLRGPSGTVAYEGRVDADSVGGYGAHGTLRIGALDLHTFLDTAITPVTQLTGHADLDVAGEALASLMGSVTVELERSLIDSLRIYPSRTRVRFANRRMLLDVLDVQSAMGALSAHGGLGLAPEIRDSILFTLVADSLGGLRRYVEAAPLSAVDGQAVPVDSLKGSLRGTGYLAGSFDTLLVHAGVDAVDVDALGAQAQAIHLEGTFDDVTRTPRGEASGSARGLSLEGVRLDTADVGLRTVNGGANAFSLFGLATNGSALQSGGTFTANHDTTLVTLDSLQVTMLGHSLALSRRTPIRVEPRRIAIDTAKLVGANGEQLTVAADLPADGPVHAILRVDSVHVADLAEIAQTRLTLGGRLSALVELAGTRQAPTMTMRGFIRGAKVGAVNVAQVTFDGHYANLRMLGNLKVSEGDTSIMDVAANVGYDLTLASRRDRFLNDTLRFTVRSHDVDLRLLESFTSSIRNAAGRFSANLDYSGPRRTAVLNGDLTITDGAATLPDPNIRVHNVRADVSARNDTVQIKTISAVNGLSGDDPNGSLSINGSIVRPLQPDDASFDLTFNAHNFHMVGRKDLADLVISFSPALRLSGATESSTLTGTIVVNSGRIYVPAASDKQLIALDENDLAGLDTVTKGRLQLVPKPPPKLVGNLSVQNVRVVMGPDVWVRSAEQAKRVNIKLGGSVSVTVSNLGAKPQLALDGSLQTERGRYLLDIASIVQQSFDIEGGALTFYGDADVFNPAVDISAIHTVRQVQSVYGGRNDLRIRVNIRGTLQAPQIALSSADSLQISPSDLISYLAFDSPSFDIGGGAGRNLQQLSAVAIGSLANLGASSLSGRYFDYVQVQTAADRLRIGSAQQASEGGFFAGTQLGIGKQLNARTFVSANAGLCQLWGAATATQRLDPGGLAQSLGGKIEYQLRPTVGVSAAIEPTLSAVLCTQGAERGLSTNFRQAGFDLFKTFRW